MPDGSDWIFDGTRLQFMCEDDEWIMSKADSIERHTVEGFRANEYPDQARVEEMRSKRKGVVAIYWDIVEDGVLELVRDPDWDALLAMKARQRRRLVKRQAKTKFAHAFEMAEAMDVLHNIGVDWSSLQAACRA